MSMNSAHNRLQRSKKDFLAQWDQVRQSWRDEVAREYGEQFLEPLLARVQAAHEAMVHLETVLTVMRRDCE